MPANRVARLPPLPRIPRAPRLASDPRQRHAKQIVGRIADMAAREMVVAGPNFAMGFHASADTRRPAGPRRRGWNRKIRRSGSMRVDPSR
jgi:hypothetical protein